MKFSMRMAVARDSPKWAPRSGEGWPVGLGLHMRFFNTAGPCVEDWHYMLPAVERLPEAPTLIERGLYFVVHAPRQTGKTTTLMALARELTKGGKYAALHFSCEAGEVAGDDHVAAQEAVLDAIRDVAATELPAELQPPAVWPTRSDAHLLGAGLGAWAERCPRPLVLFFDEFDALRGDSLVSVLRQLRDRYMRRLTRHAPWSVALCGLRDVRDYKAASGGDPERLGTSSPFNIKVESMRLGNFDERAVRVLYAQHTAETGQPFTEDAVARAFALTAGQPWLVNALAREIVDKMRIAPPEPITASHVEQARERLILTRATHLDSLVARLNEDRVRRIIEPLMAGVSPPGGATYNDDVAYVRDLGLIAPDAPLRVANPIYREVIARVLATVVEDSVVLPPRHFLAADGRLDLPAILRGFAAFWREHGEVLTGALTYHEVAPQLVLMAYLQSVVNGTGFIDREYGVGRGRIDLQLRWPYQDTQGRRQWQREALELKVWRDRKPDPLDDGLRQLDEYLTQLALDHGVLVIFDRRERRHEDAEPAPISFEQARTATGRDITVLRA
jgi:hypothetical protein